MTLICNIFGGPGTGKSTVAAGIFHQLKLKTINVELVTEYAKDMVWEDRIDILEEQIYIFAKQFRRISRLRNKVDYVIVDSPLLNCVAYMTDGYYPKLEPLVVEVMNSFNNVNYMLDRSVEYVRIGRHQTEDQAREKDAALVSLLEKHNEPYTVIQVDDCTTDVIVTNLLSR